jgi:membrane-associated phospholipid phosphatase
MSTFGTSGWHGWHGWHGTSGWHGWHGWHGQQGPSGGAASPLVPSALTHTAEALIGYWDGAVEAPGPGDADPLANFMDLDPFPRGMVLMHEGMSLFSMRPGAEKAVLVNAKTALVTLTPPEPEKLAEQMLELRAAMDLRSDRLAEILAQSNDIMPFFAAQNSLRATRKPYTALLVTALRDTVVAQEQRMKHFCSVPRPIDLSAQVQPIIETPGHSAYPSGHATEAFAFATMFAALRLSGAGTADAALIKAILGKVTRAVEMAHDTDPEILLYRLAARIADNRTIAGVHYPVDSAHGGLLGLGLTLAFVAHCLGGGKKHPVPVLSADAKGWMGDFSLRKWCEALNMDGNNGWRRGTTSLPAAENWHLLPQIWSAAVAEWKH